MRVSDGAVFLDRDGVINELVYHRDWDMSESPRTTKDFRLLPGVAKSIKALNRMGIRVILISNQPDIAKGRITEKTFDRIRKQMHHQLHKAGASLDAEYYCFHHPKSRLRAYRRNCNCRKPKPGLLQHAARDLEIVLRDSYMIGDRPSDILAGKRAGCKTIWLNDMKCEYCVIMHRMNIHPDFIFRDLNEATKYIVRTNAS
jgi:D-glycero-D-manno-heptose 1,7-bisphosphate phosphatase